MSKNNIFIETVEEKEGLSQEFFKKCEEFYKPERVMIEYNGMWELDAVDEDNMPEEWTLAQVISTVDGATFNMYWTNMSSLSI